MDHGPRRKGGSEHYDSPDYDNGTGPRGATDGDAEDRDPSNPNSPNYDNGTGPRGANDEDEDEKDRDPSNPNSPNYEG
ncbi:MAG: hypothetical protein AAB421_02140 [Patescibacteria group bacterium]